MLETHPDKLEPGASEIEKQDAERQFHKVSVFTCVLFCVENSFHDSQPRTDL